MQSNSMYNEIYIHYSQYEELRKFDPDKFDPIRNIPYFDKPWGGLWASPVDAKFGWEEWCKCNMENRLGDYNFAFVISDNANIVHIRNESDVYQLPILELSTHKDLFDGIFPVVIIDFEKCVELGIDGIRFHLDENYKLRHILRSWDCDCILILNKDIVIPKKKK